MSKLATIPVATVLVVLIAVAGAAVTIVHPETLAFDQYVKYVGLAAAVLGIGRGLDATHKP